jgi:hypothetical protein
MRDRDGGIPTWVWIVVPAFLLLGFFAIAGAAVIGYFLASRPSAPAPDRNAVSVKSSDSARELNPSRSAPSNPFQQQPAPPQLPKDQPDETPLPDGPAIEIRFKVVEEYRDNRIAADARYKGKKVRITWPVQEIGERDGQPFVSFIRIPGGVSRATSGPPVITRIGRESEPTIRCYLSDKNDPRLLKLKTGMRITVEGILTGRVDDQVHRNVDGYEFHLRIDRCILFAVEAKGLPTKE